MATMRSILRDLDRHVHMFDLDRDDLGVDLMDITSDVILQDIDTRVDPDGTPWPDLSPAYEKRKAVIAPGAPMAFLYYVMISHENLDGERTFAPHLCTMTFGTDPVAKQEAEYFQEGNANQPPRRFYEISIPAEARMDAHLDRHFAANV